MKQFILNVVLCLAFMTGMAQNRYLTKDAKINFNSSTPIEDIIAESNQATTFIDISTNEIAFSVLTTSFKFRRTLMEEHFNENYMESVKYPKAKFTGKIITPIDWKNQKQVTVQVQGTLSMHGASKDITASATITPGNNNIIASAEFKVTPESFNIVIPSAVRDKIAKEVTIKVEANYTPYKE